jgi:O-antigen ligase
VVAVSAPPDPVFPSSPTAPWRLPTNADAAPPRRQAPDSTLLGTLGIGAAAIGLAALPYKFFELDRFFVPKEVALQLVAAGALLRVGRGREGRWGAGAPRPHRASSIEAAVDVALALFLVTSLASAALAPSGWLAARALGVTAAGAALFWAARGAARDGDATGVLRAAAILPVVAVVTALAQAYGLQSEYFSLNRAPGGTFGNRNSVAHLCAIGLPVLAYLAVRARRAPETLGATTAFAAAAATLVLTRSRAAWLAALAAAVPFAVGLVRAAAARRATARWTPVLLAAAGLAALAAVRLPNTLDWRSDSPYLDSARDVVNYREGSGQGRLKQWRNSARLVTGAPLLGVGPGNWSARYPTVAPARDPSLTSEGTTANPWPSSDWVAFAAERGALGVGAIAAAFVLLLWRAHQLVWHAPDADDRLRGGALGAVLAATLTAGAFDAVLLLAAPSFLAWTVAGALAGGGDAPPAAPAKPSRPPLRRLLATALLAAAGVGASHAAAMQLFSAGRGRALDLAARLAPGDYRIQLRTAQLAQRLGRCDEARPRAARAQRMAPSAPGPARVLRACAGGRRARRR